MFMDYTRLIITTSALELGIDIGSLDAVLLLGFPLSPSIFIQRIGRVGRRQRGDVILLLGNDAIDRRGLKTAEAKFRGDITLPITDFLTKFGLSESKEMKVWAYGNPSHLKPNSDGTDDIDTYEYNIGVNDDDLCDNDGKKLQFFDNDLVIGHLQCSAFESPFPSLPSDYHFPDFVSQLGFEKSRPYIQNLVSKNLLFDEGLSQYVVSHTYKPYPPSHVNIRKIAETEWSLVVDGSSKGNNSFELHILEQIDTWRASFTIFEGRVFYSASAPYFYYSWRYLLKLEC
ncbi:putative ATP-dependent helicase hrq1 [Smittium mucronatum]|uniref:Putative ATP-dependent helicase hrq1 n=1 Tax=Smittium mucronatum TaxID=133383 RepID=A0A1R0GXC4_9FUNG|nr:putative ATP-dependent helicase hrq1 [Smittium mucronatum]